MRIAHFHGGETTLGALDNIYRHQISLASSIHFTCHDEYSKRLSDLLGYSSNIYNVGSLSLHDVKVLQLPDWQKLKDSLDIPFEDFILLTVHPETNSAIDIKEQLSCTLSIIFYKHVRIDVLYFFLTQKHDKTHLKCDKKHIL